MNPTAPAAGGRRPDRVPLDVPRWTEAHVLTEGQVARMTWALVALGVALRVVRYATNQPLWGDEAYLASSLIDRNYLDLLRPLDYHQVAPLLFLWAEHAAVQVFGFTEWSLRLFPLLCGIGGVVLFAHVAGRVLQGVPRVLAVGILAVAFYPIRHATEVKPYATDLLVAVGLIALVVEWWRDPARTRWLWALAAAVPLALGSSHPAVFVAGGISLGLLPLVRNEGRRSSWAAFAAFNGALSCSFGMWYILVIRGQEGGVGDLTRAYWAGAFPPLDRPLAIPAWLLDVHTSHMVSYPIGEAHGGSAATTALVLVGALALGRRGRRDLLGLLLAPLGLGLLAAVLGKYPYGGSARTMQYIAPAFCLLAGLGAARLLGLWQRPEVRRRGLGVGVAALVAIGAIASGLDVLRPYKFAEDRMARDFARRFWIEQGEDAELVCLKRDLGVTLNPHQWENGRTAVYRCNQAIYSPRHHHARPPAWERVSFDRPLRCVLFNLDSDDPAFWRWLASMRLRFIERRATTFTPISKRIVGGLEYEDRYEVMEFVPKDPDAIASLAREAEGRSVRR